MESMQQSAPFTESAAGGAPIELVLAPRLGGPAGAVPVAVTPTTLTLTPDRSGPIARGQVRIANTTPEEQVIWLSGQLPPVVTLTIERQEPAAVALDIAVDLAHAASFGGAAPTSAVLHLATATGMTVVRVNWRPLPYGSM